MSKIVSPGRFPKLVRRFRPSLAEVEHYARLIIEHECRPASAWGACLAEAEIQLWASRSLRQGRTHREHATPSAA